MKISKCNDWQEIKAYLNNCCYEERKNIVQDPETTTEILDYIAKSCKLSLIIVGSIIIHPNASFNTIITVSKNTDPTCFDLINEYVQHKGITVSDERREIIAILHFIDSYESVHRESL